MSVTLNVTLSTVAPGGSRDEASGDSGGGWSMTQLVFLGFTFILITASNITGNTCTLLAFCRDAKLRTAANYYICNLAACDLLIGLSSTTFYAAYCLLDCHWPFGYVWCKVWSLIDFLMCSESSLTLILISVDRLMMVKKGALYSQYATRRRSLVLIGLSWTVAFLIYGPSIIGYDHWRGHSIVPDGDCDVEFADSFFFTTITAIAEFCIPFILLTVFNLLIYLSIRHRYRRVSPTLCLGRTESQLDGVKIVDAITTNRSLARDRKAASNLALLVAVFVVCWTPYTVTTILHTLCRGAHCVNDDMYEAFTWLLWLNSSLNPFLYAYTNSRFAWHFKTYLCWCLPKKQDVVEDKTVNTVCVKVSPVK